MITRIDQVVGTIRQELDSLGIADNTIIMLMGDNGYYIGDRGYAGKWLMHDVSLRVPLIILDPRKSRKPASILDEMVLNIDLSPTILEYAGIKVPDLVQGKSLVSLMNNRKSGWRTSIFCEHLMNEPRIPKSECIRA